MNYKTITEGLIELLEKKPTPKNMLNWLYDSKNADTIPVLTACLMSIGGQVKLSDIERVSVIKDKYTHCIICELDDSYIDNIIAEDDDIVGHCADNWFISPATVTLEDECFTIIITGILDKTRINSEIISKIFMIMNTEYSNHIYSQFSDEIPVEQNISYLCNEYAMFYIPIGICYQVGVNIHPKFAKLTNVKSFLKLLDDMEFRNPKDNKKWYYSLFELSAICAYTESERYPELTYLDDTGEDEYDSSDLS